MLSVQNALLTAGDGGTLLAIFLVLLVCTPLGWVLVFSLFALIAHLGGEDPNYTDPVDSSSSYEDVGNSFDYYPYNSRSEEIDAYWADKNAKEDANNRHWEEIQAERDAGQYGIWHSRK